MLLEGQVIFNNDTAVKKQFAFSAIIKLIKNAKGERKEEV